MSDEHPIPFHAADLRLARAGKKTLIILPAYQRGALQRYEARSRYLGPTAALPFASRWQSVEPGARLWVQEEAVRVYNRRVAGDEYFHYRADQQDGGWPIMPRRKGLWCLNIMAPQKMERRDSRFFIVVVDRRVLHAQDVAPADLEAEGYPVRATQTLSEAWDAHHMLYPWRRNTPVVALRFAWHVGNIDEGVIASRFSVPDPADISEAAARQARVAKVFEDMRFDKPENSTDG